VSERNRSAWKLAIGIGVVYAVIAAVLISVGEVKKTITGHRGLAAWTSDAILPDGYDYLNIAVCVSKGNGIAFDRTDPDFRRLVTNAHRKGWYRSERFNEPGWDRPRDIVDRAKPVPTASRAPLYPVLLGALFPVFGRNYVVPRVLNCILLGLTGVLVFLTGRRIRGTAAGLLAAAVLAANTRMWAMGKQVLSEPLALTLVALATYLFVRSLSEERQLRWLVLAALALAGGVLARHVLVLCVPVAAACVFIVQDRPFRRKLARAALFLVVCSLPVLVWTVRNSVIAGMPVALGTRGGFDLPACYTRVCLESGGRWRRYSEQPYAKEMAFAWRTRGEWGAYHVGRDIFRRLIRKNWPLIPGLVLVKLRRMLVPLPLEDFHDIADIALIVLALPGLVLLRRENAVFFVGAPVVGVLLGAALFHAMPRFRVPMFAGLAVLAGVTLAAVYARITSKRSTPQSAEPVDPDR